MVGARAALVAPAREEHLPSVPALGTLYRAALTGAARRALGRGLPTRGRAATGSAPTLPEAALPAIALRVTDVRADARRLTDYQHLVGEPASDTLPPGYVHVLAFPVAMAVMARPDFPLPLLGLVHLANHVEQRRPLDVGDALDVRAWARDLRPHPKGTAVDLVAEVSVAGEVAWTGVSTYLARGGQGIDPSAGGHGRDPGPASVPHDQAPSPDSTGDPGTRTALWRLPADEGRRYAAVSGDANPIHLSRATARALGQPRAIAHGMDTAARALALVGRARGAAFTWGAAFGSPVRLPSTVAVAVRRSADGDGGAQGWVVDGRDARSGRHHVTVRIVPQA
ncbi:MaoC/PaaZ C-terminal domain-containing protein [Cellulomonas marina]|uniref:Acyl dehydratase n=1 Tax=Cellulomonas marina TaxID=988821 RepID=A0A1I0Z0M8_9CELL|nr:MaoC/PaaZ C-terminal domain-containing protein [Cellulomonas marina]GIG28159.1 acyl dehydratase [Cellulomonas marina]SFB19164.1 Acyl dehydratase [Cellulomonas marina]